MDGSNWPRFDSSCTKLEGEIKNGVKVIVHIEGQSRAFPVKVNIAEDGTEMVWSGGMPLGLFKGLRTYRLHPNESGTVFEMTEEFSGLLAPLITKSIPNLQPAFEEFAANLKSAAERVA